MLEPLLRLSDQSRLWTWCYGLFLLLATGCILLVWRSPLAASAHVSTQTLDAPIAEVAADHAESPTPRLRLALGGARLCALQPDAGGYDCAHH